MRIIAFIGTILGGLNWLMIGMFQYDFVAGIFGTQANILSRLVYAIVGISACYVFVVTLFNKGKYLLIDKKKKQQKEAQRADNLESAN